MYNKIAREYLNFAYLYKKMGMKGPANGHYSLLINASHPHPIASECQFKNSLSLC
jgi:hypothetical protein